MKTLAIFLACALHLSAQIPGLGPAALGGGGGATPAFVTGQIIQATAPGPTASPAIDHFPNPATVGNLVIYGSGLYAATAWTVTDSNSNTWTQDPASVFHNPTDPSMTNVMGYSKITATGSPFTVQALPNLGVSYPVLLAMEYSGLTGTPDGTFPTPSAGTGTSVACPPITTTNANEVVVAIVVAYTPTSVSATSGFVLRAISSNGAGSISIYAIDQIVPTAGTYTPAMTFVGPTGPYSCIDGAWF